jgi:hypothetical protein
MDDSGGLILSDAVYNKLKFVVQLVLPAASTLYFTLGNIWGFPAVENVIGTLAAVAVFLGSVLGISTKRYNESDAKYDGDVVYTTTDQGKINYSLEFHGDVPDIANMSQVLFKVKPELHGQ